MNRRALVGLGFIIAASLLSACSGPAASAPPAGPSSGSAELMPFGAPKVKDPLQVSAFVQNPCQSLTTQQVQSVNEDSTPYVFANDPHGAGGSACVWPNAHAGNQIQVTWNTEMSSEPQQPKGLDFYYSRRNDGLSNDRFVPTSVDGYPAAFIGVSDEDRADACRLSVGVKDDVLVTITYNGNPSTMTIDQDCANVTKLASDVIGNAKHTAQ